MEDKIYINPRDIKIRKSFPEGFDPSEKIETPKPLKKNRSSEKQNLKKILKNIDLMSEDELDDLEF